MTDAYSPAQQQRILAIARAGAAHALGGPAVDTVAGDDEAYLLEPRACFVTLRRRRDRALRGCIGTFDADPPLIENVAQLAGAATRDPRFVDDPITRDELPALHVDVSILTPVMPIDDPTQMRLGIDGIQITGKRRGSRVSGVFLPEVATDQGWDVETTLSMCCEHKMGLSPDAWRPPTKLTFAIFQSIVVEEAWQ